MPTSDKGGRATDPDRQGIRLFWAGALHPARHTVGWATAGAVAIAAVSGLPCFLLPVSLVDDIQALIISLKERGIGVLISDHNVRETLQICDRAYLMHEGQIIVQGAPVDIVNDPKAKRVYLGESFCM